MNKKKGDSFWSCCLSMLHGSFDAALLTDMQGNIVEYNALAHDLLLMQQVPSSSSSSSFREDDNKTSPDDNSVTDLRGRNISSLLLLFSQHGDDDDDDDSAANNENGDDVLISWQDVVVGPSKAAAAKNNENSSSSSSAAAAAVSVQKYEGTCVRNNGTGTSVRVHVMKLDSHGGADDKDNFNNNNNSMMSVVIRPSSSSSSSSHHCDCILEASFDAIFAVDRRGIIKMVNQAAVRQFGWSREELVGQSMNMICGGEHGEKHDEHLKRYLETGEKRVMGKKRELIARRKDGSEFPILLGLTEVQDKSGEFHMFYGWVTDISLQKEQEKELERKHMLTKGVVDASFDAMFAIDKDGIILMVNDAASEQFGWTRDEFLGENVSMIAGGSHASKHDGYIKRYLETGEKRVMGTQRILPARRKDGSLFPIWLGLTEVSSNNSDDGMRFVAFVRDLTDQKKMYEMEIMKAKQDAMLRKLLPEEYYNYNSSRSLGSEM